ncbi:unnamed protein product [Pedinophyceae sp. YPF-701]|nr:unnamed protein product [Pedinophyceae sp. YPF-701]
MTTLRASVAPPASRCLMAPRVAAAARPLSGALPHHIEARIPPHVTARSIFRLQPRCRDACVARAARHRAGTTLHGARLDLVTLSNLCVDIIQQVPVLPPGDEQARRKLLHDLTKNPPPLHQWEVGGSTNTLLAGARIGLRCGSIGHIGDDIYGKFMLDVFRAEGVHTFHEVMPESRGSDQDRTLLCFVLVDPNGGHAFCSEYDFGPWPLLQGVGDHLPDAAVQCLQSTRALFINGFTFDELAPEVVLQAAQVAKAAGAAVLFDPGPRAWTMADGARGDVLDSLLHLTDIVLLTSDEARALTGHADPVEAGRAVSHRGGGQIDWTIVKLGPEGSIVLHPDDTPDTRRVHRAAPLTVEVADTVGCGDSFAAAVALGYTRGRSVAGTVALANAVGAATATGRGAGRNVARADVVAGLLGTQETDTEGAEEALELLTSSCDALGLPWRETAV